ncbi:MAG: hypothetical protein C7B45_15575 [Sulfobacillus acidophilus]|uniref:Helix-turn-helix domain-containing protein n=1 Tax=Sulfobacillus acidophilus TaxID=53633 RepID=A0A2T2WDH3_9FIRM|nr:MAG: hypothetical protein C7B45_15575 [Sulfobacillus acidophilus]
MPDEKRFLTVAEVARILDMSKIHLYRRIDQGEIPHIKIGGAIRIPKWWIDQLEQGASSTPPSEAS